MTAPTGRVYPAKVTQRDATVARLKKAEDLLRSARVYHFTAPMATAIDDYFAEKGAPE